MKMIKSKSGNGKVHIITSDYYGYTYCGIAAFRVQYAETEETPTCKTCIKLAHHYNPGMLRYMVAWGYDYTADIDIPNELYTSVEAAQEACYVNGWYDTYHIYELDLISNKINGSFMGTEIVRRGEKLSRDCKWETGE